MSDLVAFLKARLDEDEAYLKSNSRHLWTERPLREVAAKRAILASLESARDRFSAVDDAGLEIAAEHLATVYSGHPDYDPAWKPEPPHPDLMTADYTDKAKLYPGT